MAKYVEIDLFVDSLIIRLGLNLSKKNLAK